ncbi:MAG TPA: NfeD family protein [Bacteroidales bacterium]|nr:NfeD family protein [Bacteroidales bacterium]HSA43778.1 NfeD family protein [Bacteroidales bacterium]
MNKRIVLPLLLLFFSLLSVPCLPEAGGGGPAKVLVFPVKEMIAPPIWHKTKKAWAYAKEEGVDLILIHMNTYGGMLESADSLRTLFLQSDIPVWVFIDNNAASAGALISIACERIYMRQGASIGAATVVNQEGEKMPDKYQSYMRSMMRATAEARNRDPDIAEAMVDPSRKVTHLVDSGKVLTLTASEAMKLGFCDDIGENVDEVLKKGGIPRYEIRTFRLTALDKLIAFLVHPAVSGLLILIIVAGIYFEFQSPGAIFPIVAALIAVALYFAPLYLEGLAAHWEIIVFFIGLILIAVEIFVIPGFGVAGISGIFLVIASLTLAMINNLVFDFSPVDGNAFLRSFFIVVIAMFTSIVGSLLLSRKLFTSNLFGGLALNTTEDSADGYIAADSALARLVGAEGKARSILRPGGKVIVEGEIYDAVAETGYIDPGESIVVLRYDKTQLVVRKL